MKNGGDNGAKKNWSQSVITFTSPKRINGFKTPSCLLKGQECSKSHVTLIQEMNGQ